MKLAPKIVKLTKKICLIINIISTRCIQFIKPHITLKNLTQISAKKTIKRTTISILLIASSIVASNLFIKQNAEGKTYTAVCAIPKNKVGLLLGAAKHLPSGAINLYYQYRIDATVKLYNAGKITHILISGDNGRKEYDEPTVFKNDLIKRGIPANKIYLDYAGFRTLDSIIRAKEVFGLNSFTIISQKFHNERAIYLADKYHIKAIGFNAQKVIGKRAKKTNRREYLARVKAYIDILFNVNSKFLGPKIEKNAILSQKQPEKG